MRVGGERADPVPLRCLRVRLRPLLYECVVCPRPRIFRAAANIASKLTAVFADYAHSLNTQKRYKYVITVAEQLVLVIAIAASCLNRTRRCKAWL